MAVALNPSFETADQPDGHADDWAVSAVVTSPDCAVFGQQANIAAAETRTTYAAFDRWWRLPDSRRLPAGSQHWGDFEFGVGFGAGAAALVAPEFVAAPVLVVQDDIVATVSVTFEVKYTDQSGNINQLAYVTIPDGALAGTEYAIPLLAGDYGFLEVVDIQDFSGTLLGGMIEVHGGWQREPYNGPYTAAYDNAEFAAHPLEPFEVGWDNDSGFRFTFEQVGPESAVFDGDGEESFDDSWQLPATSGTQFNEDYTFAVHNFIDSDELVFPITLNHTWRIEWLDGGTDDVLTGLLTGTYASAAALAAAIMAPINGALTADPGPVSSGFFQAVAIGNSVRVYNAHQTYAMRLLPASIDSLWAHLGYPEGDTSTRLAEGGNLEFAAFNVPVFDLEWFEEQWRENENFMFSFVGPPTDLEAAVFDTVPEAYEDFSEDWVLTLT